MTKNKLLILCLSLLISCQAIFAATSIPIYVNKQLIDSQTTPAYISSSNKTMIPVRTVGNALNLNVDWQSPYVILSGKHLTTQKPLTVRIDSKTQRVILNGQVLRNCIEIKESRSYITLRVLAEAFGYDVVWKNKSVYISKPTLTTPPTPNPSPSVPPTSTPPSTDAQTRFENEVLTLVNKERANTGLSPLSMDESVRKVARIKSTDMRSNNYFSHTSPTYGSPFDMLKQFGISYRAAAENIAQGYSTPEAVVKGWMNSSGHRANILNANYTHIGIGYDAKGHYWTQMFIAK